MKTYATMIVVAALVALGSVTGARAQKNLDALREKCSLDDWVDKNVIVHRDEKTGRKTFTTVRIDIKDNAALVSEFLEAFAQDEPQAYTIAKETKNGRTLPRLLRFPSNGKQVWYGLLYKDPANAGIIYTQGEMVPAAAKQANESGAKIYYVPKGSTLKVNGETMTAEQARAKGLHVREQPTAE